MNLAVVVPEEAGQTLVDRRCLGDWDFMDQTHDLGTAA